MNRPGKTYYPNMDILRYVLSIAVIIAHINVLADYNIFFPISSFEAVGGFFSLSGFLMYPNYIRHNNFWKYTKQRALRILPPYFFIVMICALGLVTVSTFSTEEFFTNSDWWKYLVANLSFLNWLQPSLPGVFTGSEFYEPAVNGSLWTMKVEWCLYFSVPIFIYCLRKLHFNKKYFAIAIILISIAYRIGFSYLFAITGKGIFEILARQIFGQLAYFYCGMYVFFHKDILQKHYLILLIAGVVLYILSSFNWILQCLLNPFALTAIIMSLCFIPYNYNFLKQFSNISYEMYLFHFPIIQLSIQFGLNKMSSLCEIGFVFLFTVLLSYMASKLITYLRNI